MARGKCKLDKAWWTLWLTTPNRSQVVKEDLAQHRIPAALQKRQVVRRSKLKLPGGEISYPTHSTVAAVKHTNV